MTVAPRPVAPTSPLVASRYQLERRLGEGASGAVYLAKDLETGEYVAYKQLLRVDAKNVLRLKREFRALQAVNYPHIVKLYDMGQVGTAWFLTMEYVDGLDLRAYLNAVPDAEADAPISARLISAFRQLAQGIAALHEFGMLHRDLKPSNVMVSGERVVVLDFGLVRELHTINPTVSDAGSVAGTPAYMAPEQLNGQELSPASDWYAFGVMLYEAVSGMLPIEGPIAQLLRAKLERDPSPLAALAPSAPSWLTDLCMALLRRDATLRPSGQDVLALFTAADPAAAIPRMTTETFVATETESGTPRDELFGRERELELLQRVFADCESRGSLAVHVRATSGVGKSALVEHFLQRIAEPSCAPGEAAPLVLRSRCYELEAMPFKALDGLIDALMRHLAHLPDIDVAHLLPADAATLATVFPVLDRLTVMQHLRRGGAIYDALETRKRAETALRNLLDNLAARSTVIVWIDDLQWGDLDSARILQNWLAQPSPRPVMFVFSYRSDEIATSSCLAKLLGAVPEAAALRMDNAIDLAPLGDDQVRALCEQRMRVRVPGRSEMIERVVHDAQGSPFLASQLMALAEAKVARGEIDLHELSLDAMVAQTGALLADDAKVLLAALAVAGRPVPPRLALQAAGVKRGGRAHLHDLRSLNLVRTREVAGVRMLEVYHDRIRERIRQTLSDVESRELHRRLFHAIHLSDSPDPDWLHRLALGAGDHQQALNYGVIAAERASAALAFERAAGLYQVCSDIAPEPERGELFGQLSSACARAGRGVDAAKAALEAAKHADANTSVVWLHRAAQHYLRCGHFDAGEALLQRVLEAKQIRVPETTFGLKLAIAWERLLIRLFGRRAARVSAALRTKLLERFDLLTALTTSTYFYDPLRGALFQTRALRCALQAGEPARIVRALCSAAMGVAGGASGREAEKAAALFGRAQAINQTLSVPEERTLAVARANIAFSLGQMPEAREYMAAAERLLRSDTQEDPIGNYGRRMLVASMRLGTLEHFGEYGSFLAEQEALGNEATAHGNRFALLQFAYARTIAEQIQGKGGESCARLDAERAELPRDHFGALHSLHLAAVLISACWKHDYAWATQCLAGLWPRFERSIAHRAPLLSQRIRAAHARLLLNMHALARGHGAAPAAVYVDLEALAASSGLVAKAHVLRIRARLALASGKPDQALTQLRECVALREQCATPHECARDQFALGVILDGAEGRAMCTAARARIHALGVADVETDLRAHYPELMEPR